MIIGIDACNIRNGGGLEHLRQIVFNCRFNDYKIDKIIIWSNKKTLECFNVYFDNRIVTKTHFLLNSKFFGPFIYQIFYLKKSLIQENCNIVLVPGGIFLNSFAPFVTISQNMLPFSLTEAFRYKQLSKKIRFLLIRILQSHTFKKANGLIFLSTYAKLKISDLLKLNSSFPVIPHGYKPNDIKLKRELTFNNKLHLLYVSAVSPYKHQWNVAEAVCNLFLKGNEIHLTIVGPHEKYSSKKLLNVLKKYPCSKKCINIVGEVASENIGYYYNNSNAFIFASTCENNPVILTEAISAGLPIISSFYPPMNEVLSSDDTIFFDPLDVESIQNAIQYAIQKKIHMVNNTDKNPKIMELPSWQLTSNATFNYLITCLNKYENDKK
jgi:glycosyltransferase involved in cell wall biosynthesis